MPETKNRVWTIRELMKYAIEHLQKTGFEDARLNVELLLAYTLKIQRIELYTNFDKPLKSTEVDEFRNLFLRRLKHEPVQYIIGSVNFMGLILNVDTRVLIPRPETETLVEQAMLYCQRINKPSINIIDIGTGSGNIAISIAKYVKNSFVTSVDISEDALLVAKSNAKKHNVESRIEFICADIFNPNNKIFNEKYDLLVSNPPYIPKDEWEQLNLEIKNFEPPIALTDGQNGLNFYLQISDMSKKILNPGGAILVEIGLGQSEFVLNEFKRAGIEQLQIIKDLQGIPRVITGVYGLSDINLISLN